MGGENPLVYTCTSCTLQDELLLRYIWSSDEQKRIVQACHIDPTAGHMGKSRTIYRIKERFMWHGIVKAVKELVCYYSMCIINIAIEM